MKTYIRRNIKVCNKIGGSVADKLRREMRTVGDEDIVLKAEDVVEIPVWNTVDMSIDVLVSREILQL